MYRDARVLRPRTLLFAAAFCAACSGGGPSHLPPLSAAEFWQLSTALSEPPGEFAHDDNLVSNELLFAEFARLLRQRGGVYIGVGPEQNFSYIARLRPALAFVVDIRQDNRNLHLLYKALFELSGDRADFVSRLFSRPRPAGTDVRNSVDGLFRAFADVSASAELLERTIALVRQRLVAHRQFPLSAADLAVIRNALEAFFADGPELRYGRLLPPSRTRPSYRTLMTTTDLWGTTQSYLASEESFAFVKQLQADNLLIPVVGNFAGNHALRGIGDHLRVRGLRVTAFYASNVEVYLTRTQRKAFCANLEALPHDDETRFIGNRRLLRLDEKLETCAQLQPSLVFPDGFGGARP